MQRPETFGAERPPPSVISRRNAGTERRPPKLKRSRHPERIPNPERLNHATQIQRRPPESAPNPAPKLQKFKVMKHPEIARKNAKIIWKIYRNKLKIIKNILTFIYLYVKIGRSLQKGQGRSGYILVIF